MAYSGKFSPKNPEKYLGDPSNIVYRSLWERNIMVRLDERVDVLHWASEELNLPYRSPVDLKIHRYFPDFIAKMKKEDGTTFIMMIEVKPHAQSIEPVKGKKVTKRFIREVMDYSVNQAKWSAARAYCADKGWEFVVFTEKDIFPKSPK
jgi:hypothetical protein